MRTNTREIKALKPRYPTWLDKEKSLSELLAEEELNQIQKQKVKKLQKRKIISCADCEMFTMTEVRDGKTYGKMSCKGKCIHL